MKFTQDDAAKALKALGIDFTAENFTLNDLVAGMNAEARHGTAAKDGEARNQQSAGVAVLLFPARGEKRLGTLLDEGCAAQRSQD